MFPFHKLVVYHKAKNYHQEVAKVITTYKLEEPIRSQLKRASLSIVLNIAEGSGRYSKADRRNFFIISRASVFESVAALDILLAESIISKELYISLHSLAEELSRILYTLTTLPATQET